MVGNFAKKIIYYMMGGSFVLMTFLAVSHRYAQPNKLAFDESSSIDGANEEDITSLKK